MNNPSITTKKVNQTGVASILLTMMMMIVISLIVIGFAQIARRGQRNTLDTQLSTQAYYAAETAINDAIKVGTPDKSTCPTGSGSNVPAYQGLNPVLNANSGVSYTCLIVKHVGGGSDTTPLKKSISDQDNSWVVPLNPTGPIDNFLMSWTPTDSARALSGCPSAQHPQDTAGNWNCPFPIIRIDLVSTSSVSQATLRNSSTTMSAFLKPSSSGGGKLAFTPGTQGIVSLASCTTSLCTERISVPAGNTTYGLRLVPIYGNGTTTTVSVSGYNGTTVVGLSGAQVIIDATGKAQDILRRVEVIVGTTAGAGALHPDYAIQTNDSICKRFSLNGSVFDASTVDSRVKAGSPGNPVCGN